MQTGNYRTTIDFEPALFRLIREKAFREGKTVREIVHEASKAFLGVDKAESFEEIYAHMRKVSKMGKKVDLVKFVRKDRDSH